VRLKAMEALHGFDQDANVLNAVLDALMHDSNPGVRNEAVDELRATVDAGNASGDPQIARVLRDLSERDPNNYIRLQAAAAVRQLSSGPLK
jgi:HEAT repeat protein